QRRRAKALERDSVAMVLEADAWASGSALASASPGPVRIVRTATRPAKKSTQPSTHPTAKREGEECVAVRRMGRGAASAGRIDTRPWGSARVRTGARAFPLAAEYRQSWAAFRWVRNLSSCASAN